jgi:hypothetical protein
MEPVGRVCDARQLSGPHPERTHPLDIEFGQCREALHPERQPLPALDKIPRAQREDERPSI